MKTLNLFFVLTIMAFIFSCATTMKSKGPKTVTTTIVKYDTTASGKILNSETITTVERQDEIIIGPFTSVEKITAAGKYLHRVANARQTNAVTETITDFTKNHEEWKGQEITVVALTEATHHNPDEKTTTENRNRNKGSIAGELARSNSGFSSTRNNSSGITHITGFYKSGQWWHPEWDTKGFINFSKDSAIFLSKHPTCEWAKRTTSRKDELYK